MNSSSHKCKICRKRNILGNLIIVIGLPYYEAKRKWGNIVFLDFFWDFSDIKKDVFYTPIFIKHSFVSTKNQPVKINISSKSSLIM